MSYSVEHVRYTLECDCCGHTEKRDLDARPNQELGTKGWGGVQVTNRSSHFCCPVCLEAVNAILNRREREEEAAHAAKEAACEHDYGQRGLLMQCSKCQRFR